MELIWLKGVKMVSREAEATPPVRWAPIGRADAPKAKPSPAGFPESWRGYPRFGGLAPRWK